MAVQLTKDEEDRLVDVTRKAEQAQAGIWDLICDLGQKYRVPFEGTERLVRDWAMFLDFPPRGETLNERKC